MTDQPRFTTRSIAWEYGIASVEARGGMLGPALFLLPDGRQVAPLQVAPWFCEPVARTLDGLMPRLRGDWPCLPFGFDVDRPAFGDWPATSAAAAIDDGHGFAANHDWEFVDAGPDEIAMAISYPDHHPIRLMHRRIMPDPDGAAIDIELTVEARRDCRLPIGVHPTFRLPQSLGAFEIGLDGDAEIATFPGELDASAIFAPGQFAKASRVPLKAGGSLDIRHVPFDQRTEDLVQVLHGGGGVTLTNPVDGYAVRLTWQAEHFPSFLIWFSNRGRSFEPWNGRHLALGIEPVCSAFDLGTAVAGSPNPINRRGIATAVAFEAGRPWTTRYRIAVMAAERR